MKQNETLIELWIGCLVSGVIFQGTLLWLFHDKVAYSLGLWLGVLTAMFFAWHMARSIDKIVDGPEGSADKSMRFGILIRYAVAAAMIVVAAYVPVFHPVAVFIGIMSLKTAAFLQPLIHKMIGRPEKTWETTEEKEQER